MATQKKKVPAAGNSGTFAHRHLTSIALLSAQDINLVLDRADRYADQLADNAAWKADILYGRTVLIAFFENSTRTRVSFEMAAKKLGADVINLDIDTSSVSKGESLMDTVTTLDAMRPDALIIRHKEYGAPEYISKHVRCAVVNAGDSWREHPTQALLDALTIRRAKGKIEGLSVAICGDIAHSRVAGSNIALFSKLGAKIRIVAPSFLMPEKFDYPGIETFTSMEDGLPGCDIVMMLRNQKERMDAKSVPDDETFFRRYGLTAQRLALAKPGALVMHPGPMNRGVEISDEVADDPKHSLILEQVRLGVPTRMAVLDLLINK